MRIDEDRLRQALHHRAEGIEPGGGSWPRIQQQVDETARRRQRRRLGASTGAVAAAMSPIAISGQARAYEGTVQVEVRQASGEAIGRDFVTAGALGSFGPFAAEIAFEPPRTEGLGALVLSTESAVDGSTLEATVVSLDFGPVTSTPTTVPPGPDRGQRVLLPR